VFGMPSRNPEFDPQSLLPLPAAAFHILVALAEGDRHGYAIMQDVASGTSGKLKLNPGTLYTTIKRLLDQGLVTEVDERPDPEEDDERRRYYRLTEIGRQVAKAEAVRLQQALAFARQAGLAPKRT
jgi:DNA-binding PadR family transcriptional regulator